MWSLCSLSCASLTAFSEAAGGGRPPARPCVEYCRGSKLDSAISLLEGLQTLDAFYCGGALRLQGAWRPRKDLAQLWTLHEERQTHMVLSGENVWYDRFADVGYGMDALRCAGNQGISW